MHRGRLSQKSVHRGRILGKSGAQGAPKNGAQGACHNGAQGAPRIRCTGGAPKTVHRGRVKTVHRGRPAIKSRVKRPLCTGFLGAPCAPFWGAPPVHRTCPLCTGVASLHSILAQHPCTASLHSILAQHPCRYLRCTGCLKTHCTKLSRNPPELDFEKVHRVLLAPEKGCTGCLFWSRKRVHRVPLRLAPYDFHRQNFFFCLKTFHLSRVWSL